MPKQKRREAFPPSPSPVREGESWKRYIDRLRGEAELGPAQMAGIMAATTLMRRSPNAPAEPKLLEALGAKMLKQPSLRVLSKDPEALRLARAGNGAELIVRMGERRKLAQDALAQYEQRRRDPEADHRVLRASIKSMKDSFSARSPAQREREGKLFREMLRRMEHAATLCGQGIPLDGKTTRQLVQAVQRYNDGGSRIPGGRQAAGASKQALCVLKQFMPEERFHAYCGSINRVRGAQSPYHLRHIEPKDYTEELLTGESRSAREILLATQRRMMKNGVSLEGCAVAAAVMELCGGNPNTVISKDSLQKAVSELKTPGSAFLRVMEDEEARKRMAELAAKGEIPQMGRSIIRDAQKHSARAAQWQIDQNLQKAGQKSGGMSVDRLANILAARAVASNGKAGQVITNGVFKAMAEEIRNSKGFARLAAQYRQDPGVREKIDKGFAAGDAGRTLEREYARTTAQPERKAEQEVVPTAMS